MKTIPTILRLLDQPLYTGVIVLASVFLILSTMELLNSNPKTLAAKAPQDNNTPPKEIEPINTSLIKTRIDKAKNKEQLQNILTELKKDSINIIAENGGNEKPFNDLLNDLKKKEIEIKQPPLIKPDNPPAPAPPKPPTYNPAVYQLLLDPRFDLQAANAMLQQQKGANATTRSALETYKAICLHKIDYQNIKTELQKIGDNAYYEKSERLSARKIKGKSIDDFEEENYAFLQQKPDWLTGVLQAEIRRWWDDIDVELERIDEDY